MTEQTQRKAAGWAAEALARVAAPTPRTIAEYIEDNRPISAANLRNVGGVRIA